MSKKLTSVTFVTDCADVHAMARVEKALVDLEIAEHIVPLPLHGELGAHAIEHMAALHAIDQLSGGNYKTFFSQKEDTIKHTLLINAAPRTKKSQGKNGSPFCVFNVGNTCIIASFNESLLGLIADVGIESTVYVFDRLHTPQGIVREFEYTDETVDFFTHTQFRSLEWLPRLVHILKKYDFNLTHPEMEKFYSSEFPVQSLSSYKSHLELSRIFLIDCFGNIKTSISEKIIPQDRTSVTIDFIKNKELTDLQTLTLPVYKALDEVPEGTLALVRGSSGMYGNKLYELMVGKGNAVVECKKQGVDITFDTFLKVTSI